MDKQTPMHHITLHKAKKRWYKRVWVWILIVLVVGSIGASLGSSGNTNTPQANSAAAGKPAPKPKQWVAADYYAKIQTGMTKAQVEQVTGKKSADCTESSDNITGKYEICSYGDAFADKGSLTVTYDNDKVSSKTKSDY